MHTGFDPNQLYSDWQASGLSFEDFMIGVKQGDIYDNPYSQQKPPINNSYAFFDASTAQFFMFGNFGNGTSNYQQQTINAPPQPVVPDKDIRIRQINDELDILRGRRPTPKGYRVNALRAKELMAELKQLLS